MKSINHIIIGDFSIKLETTNNGDLIILVVVLVTQPLSSHMKSKN